ncbi:hypothetical protein ES707_20424 [subsurface metagenome]
MIKDLVKDIVKHLPSKIVPGIVGFISVPIVTRLFSPDEFGNYSLVLTTVSVLVLLILWFSMSVIRFFPIFEKEKSLLLFISKKLVRS